MAEGLLRHHLAVAGVDARVRSAGTMAWGGQATSHAIEVMHDRGIDITRHESGQLDAVGVEAADLVLGMTRQHVWGVVALRADVAERTFLVGELARLGADAGPRRQDELVRDWVARVAGQRPPGPVLGRADDEIADPVGEPLDVYRRTAARLDRDLRAIATVLAPGSAASEG